MKKILVGAALAAAVAAPGIASADTTGFIDLGIQTNDFDYTSDSFESYTFGGAIIHDLSDTMTIQGDGRTMHQDWGYGTYTHGYSALHLSTDLGGWDVGGFVTHQSYYDDSGLGFGAETRTAFGNLSIDGSVALVEYDDGDYDATAWRVGAAYFFTPNLAITGGASTTELDDDDITELSLGGAYQFANNVALTAGYTDTDGENGGGGDWSGESFTFGVRFNFGGGTLQDNTNDGAWSAASHLNDTTSRW
jgi:hypothetical protein